MTPLTHHIEQRNRPVRSKIPATLERVKARGILIGQGGARDCYLLCGGAFLLWPTTGFWRSADNTKMGYDIDTLFRLIEEYHDKTKLPGVEL